MVVSGRKGIYVVSNAKFLFEQGFLIILFSLSRVLRLMREFSQFIRRLLE